MSGGDTPPPPPGYSAADIVPVGAKSAPAGPPQTVGTAASNYWDQASPVNMVRGAVGLLKDPIGTVKNDFNARGQMVSQALGEAKRGQIAKAAARFLEAAIPFQGEALNKASDQLTSGDYAGGIGTTLGIGTNVALPEVAGALAAPLKSGMGGVASRLYRSSLKFPGGTPLEDVAAASADGLESGIKASRAGLGKLKGQTDQLGQAIANTPNMAPQAGPAPVSVGAVDQGLTDLADKFSQQAAPRADLAGLEDVRQQFLDKFPQGSGQNISLADAQKIKTATQQALKRQDSGAFTSGAADRGSIEAQKKVQGELADQIKQADPSVVALNERYGNKKTLAPAIEKSIDSYESRNPLVYGGGVAAAAFGHPVGAVMGVLAHKVLTDPAIRSAVAISLARTAGISISEANLRIAGALNAAGAQNTDQPPAK